MGEKVIAGDMKELDGKLRLDLLPARVLQKVCGAFAYGGLYYDYWNWRLGTTGLARYYGAALRHMMRWYECQGVGARMDRDPDSEIHHIDAAIASLMILRDLQLGAPNVTDDRPAFMVDRLKLKRESQEENQ